MAKVMHYVDKEDTWRTACGRRTEDLVSAKKVRFIRDVTCKKCLKGLRMKHTRDISVSVRKLTEVCHQEGRLGEIKS